MAQARKAPLRPAPAEKSKAANPASPPVVTSSATRAGLRMALWLLLLALLTGAVPLALTGQVFGYWRVPFASPALPFLPGAVVYDAPLAQARPMVTNATIQVASAPGARAIIATLEPGFPVQVTRYATAGGVRWAQIRWTGPTKAAGGSGWAQAAQLRAPVAGSAKPIGDLGALSQAVARGASAAGSGFAATLYFPKSGYTYRTTTAAKQVIILGQQIGPIVLVADYGLGLAAQQPRSINNDLVSGNSEALIFVYHAVGDGSGMGAYMERYHISGFRFAAVPTQSIATVQGLGLFYSALTEEPLASPDDQRQIFELLAGANKSAATYASASRIGSGALVVTTEKTTKGYTTIVAGQLRPASGPAVVVVAVSADQPTAAKSQAALQAFFKPLIATLG